MISYFHVGTGRDGSDDKELEESGTEDQTVSTASHLS